MNLFKRLRELVFGTDWRTVKEEVEMQCHVEGDVTIMKSADGSITVKADHGSKVSGLHVNGMNINLDPLRMANQKLRNDAAKKVSP